MNKTIIIAGGSSLASLAVGATAGYFLAKKKVGKAFDERLDAELAEIKKHYSVLLMQAREKPDTPETLLRQTEEAAQPVVEKMETLENPVTDKGRRAAAAVVDYTQPFKASPDNGQVVENNIFGTTAKPKKQLPPRGPSGRFLPTHESEEDAHQGDDPYKITQEEFLVNDPEHEQENLLWFVNDRTLLMVADSEPVDIDRVGEANLTLFGHDESSDDDIICVRNTGLRVDYEIRRTEESLTEYMGLGESESDTGDGDEDDASLAQSSRWSDAMGAARQSGGR